MHKVLKNLSLACLTALYVPACMMSCEDGFYNEEDYVIKADTSTVTPGGGGGVLTADSSFVSGVDISYCTEMEAAGVKFYRSSVDTTTIKAGTAEPTNIFQLMKETGMEAVRLRVWVNPESSQPNRGGASYGAWCDKADVVAKAKRAKAAGMDVMIDFHYSDCFADPSAQYKPTAWTDMSDDELQTALATHTKDVLSALKAEGITPRWVQVGNETVNGMVWDEGRIRGDYSDAATWKGFVALTNSGYEAVKEIFPDAYVILHLPNGQKDNSLFFQSYKQNGGKFDMMGLSYYPNYGSWESEIVDAASRVQSLYKNLHIPVMIVETGFSTYQPIRAKNAMKLLMQEMKGKTGCRGIFYWEPEVYGGWEHYLDKDGSHYTPTTLGKEISSNGAFTKYGQPADALRAIGDIGEIGEK